MKDRLTSREFEVATAVANGLPNKLIAYTLNIAEGTVKVHLRTIFLKLGVSNRTALAVMLYRYITPD